MFAVPPLLCVFRAVVVLVAFGGFWLSARSAALLRATGGTIPITFVLVAINIGWSALAIKRAAAGVSAPAQRSRWA